MWKRISAFLLDVILFAVLAVGVATVMSYAFNYSEYSDFKLARENEYLDKYKAEYIQKNGEDAVLDLDVPYNEMSEEHQQIYFQEIYSKVVQACNSDSSYVYADEMTTRFSVIIIVFSTMISIVLLEFVVPLLFKNGQTIGKKMFGLGVIRTNAVKASNFALFVRMLLGKHTIETMAPTFFILMVLLSMSPVGLFALGAYLILQVVLICATRTNSVIHDLISDTVVVDINTQMVFEDEQALLEYKKRIHQEEVAKSQY